MPCLFCGSLGPMSVEDVVPRWLPKALGIGGPSVLTTESLRDGRMIERRARQRRMKLITRSVCRRCNNGWLSRLENDFQRTFVGAITGQRPLVLDRRGQRLAATWAVKTVLLMEHAYRFLGEHAYAPPSNLAYLYRRRRPPPADDTRVWLGAVGPGWRDVWHQASAYLPAEDAQEAADRTGWYVATVAVGHVLLHAFGRDIEPYVSNVKSAQRGHPVWALPEPWSRHLVKIWPTGSDHVSWPPELVIPQDDLLILHPLIDQTVTHAERPLR